jgi:hypothetical protein
MKKEQTIEDYMASLDHPLKESVEKLSEILLGVDPSIAVQVKWNSPSYYYTGEIAPFDPKEYKRDIVVLNLHKKESILLVFPTGARINDPSGILEGKFTDGRKTIKFSNLSEVNAGAEDLRSVVRNWIETVEKDV